MIAGKETGNGGVAITPSDTVNQGTFRRLYVGATGNVTMIGLDGVSVLFEAIPTGATIECGFTRVMATGTTATKLVGIT